MERMAEVLDDCDEQALHHFVSNSPWDFHGVVDDVARQADELLGGHSDTGLILDDSGFVKKGKESVGVQRQWCGRLGKTENCQVGVFAVLGRGNRAVPVDFRLYLPSKWIENQELCQRTGIPEEDQVLKSKSALALEMVDGARKKKLRFAWIGMDSGYGKDAWLLRALAERKQTFVAGVHRNLKISVEKPDQEREKSRKTSSFIRVDTWVSKQPEDAWRKITVRDTTKGLLEVEVLDREVWVQGKGACAYVKWRLYVRREIRSHSEVSYTMTNAPSTISTERLALMQAQRFFIEQAFRDAKSEAGMADYQVRGWRGWHHHMALVLMAMLFLLEMRIKFKDEVPLLSCHDIVEILASALPASRTSEERILKQIEARHRKRSASISLAYARQRRQSSG